MRITIFIVLCLLCSGWVQSQKPKSWLENYLDSQGISKITTSTPKVSPIKKLDVNSQWQLLAWGGVDNTQRTSNSTTFMVDIDFEQKDKIPALKLKGATVICYYSAGTIEDYREDYNKNKSAWDAISLKVMGEWPNERWLDISQFDKLTTLMKPRLDYAKSIGCDGVEPDNVDCFTYPEECYGLFNGGKGVSEEEAKLLQIRYNTWTANYAHSLGLSIGLKNAGSLVGNLIDLYDFSVVESCFKYKECNTYTPFINKGKPVFAVEYMKMSATNCNTVTKLGIKMKHCQGSNDGNLCLKSLNNCP